MSGKSVKTNKNQQFMRRHEKQRPKIDIKPNGLKKICETASGTASLLPVTVCGLNKSGKKAVRAMDEKIKRDKQIK
jgi:hypothetical protein